ncbi:MAG: bifunctional oligoribonuclease/PAP phosphatase NrnA [Chloroflexi bacterium]|nr:bifunctional oligoribonuclease/PAP phosphatase NrnA [Chloroflexota bacterium]
MHQTVKAIQETLSEVERVLIITHVGPDGDAIGSLTAVAQALIQLGKQVVLMCDDRVPTRFTYLDLSDQVSRPYHNNQPYDLIVAVDCGDEQRMGQAYATLPEPRPSIINIDHHVTNTRFGNINLVGETAVSTTEILFDLFAELNITLTIELAMSLLTGLVTDTLGFRTVGVSAKTLQIASELMAAGADLPLITQQGLNVKSFSTIKLWRAGLGSMKLEDGLIWAAITYEQRKEIGYAGASSNGLTNLLADVDQAAIGAVLMDVGNGNIRIGFRCRPPYNVAELARNLGGGGHPLAAGCTMQGSLAEVESLVVQLSKEAIQQQEIDAGHGGIG